MRRHVKNDIRIKRHVRDDTGKGITHSTDHCSAPDRPTVTQSKMLTRRGQMNRYQVNQYV
jgi:hypothetical protein